MYVDPFETRYDANEPGNSHRILEEFRTESGELVSVECSCGYNHPIEGGKPLTGFAQCICGRVHSLVTGAYGRLYMDTGWY